MSDYRVLIMAGGTKRDWAPQGYRQLLTVDNVTLIDRIIHQVRDVFLADPVIVINDYTNPFGSGYRYFVPEVSRTPPEALSYTERFWGETTVVLQGDVFYPEVVMDLIYLKEFFAFGRGAELYALKFDRYYHGKVKEAISKAKESRLGRLWSVYRAFEGYNVEKHVLGPTFYTFKDQDDLVVVAANRIRAFLDQGWDNVGKTRVEVVIGPVEIDRQQENGIETVLLPI